jgi:hypothetical protein
MSDTKGSSDESIGRPREWREGRYQQPGKPIDQSVTTPDTENRVSNDRISTPVTQRDYQQRKSVAGNCSLGHWNVGSVGNYATP